MTAPKIHSYRGPSLSALGLTHISASGDAPAPSTSLLQPQAHSQPGLDLSEHIQTWKSHLQSPAGFRKQGWRGGQRAGENRDC